MGNKILWVFGTATDGVSCWVTGSISNGNGESYVGRYNSSGSAVWEKRIPGNSGPAYGQRLAVDSLGTYLYYAGKAAGAFCSTRMSDSNTSCTHKPYYLST